jgi:hypothetical protein
MKKRILAATLCLAGGLLAPCLRAAGEQPRYDLLRNEIVAEIKPTENRIEAISTLHIRILDKTNFITFRLNGNLFVTNVEDEQGEPLRFIQDDSSKFEVMINLVRPQEPGTEKTIHMEFNGIFAQSEFDFFKELGASVYAFIGPDEVELPASSLWCPQNPELTDRCTYELQVTMPTGLRPFTAMRLEDTIDSGLLKTYVFRSSKDILPPTLLAGRYQVYDYDVEGIRLEAWFLSEFPERENLVKRYEDFLTYLLHRWAYQPVDPTLYVVEVSDKYPRLFGMEGAVFLTTKEITSKSPAMLGSLRKFAYQKWLFPLQVASPAEIWIPEGISQYTAVLYYLDTKNLETFESLLRVLAVDALKFNDAETIHQGYQLGVGSEKYDSVVVAKSAWVFHMLRNLVGPDPFDRILAEVSAKGANQPVDTDFIAAVTREVTGQDYGWFFNQWINTVDLPEFSAEYIIYRLSSGGFQTVGKINQNLAVFQIPLEIKIVTKGQDELKVVDIKGESSRLNLETQTRPTKIIIDPNFRILRKSKDLEIEVFLVKGDDFLENNDFLGAIDEYKRAIDQDPRNSLAYYKLALVFYEQFNYNAAQNTFRDALNGDQKPEWVVALCYMYMGKVFDLLGQRQRAVAEYNKAINTNDDSRGAVTEARKYVSQPFTRKKTFLPGQKEEGAESPPAPDSSKPPPDKDKGGTDDKPDDPGRPNG